MKDLGGLLRREGKILVSARAGVDTYFMMAWDFEQGLIAFDLTPG